MRPDGPAWRRLLAHETREADIHRDIRRLLDRYGIEIGGGLGNLAGRIWRIGLMGENARVINVEALLFALRKEIG